RFGEGGRGSGGDLLQQSDPSFRRIPEDVAVGGSAQLLVHPNELFDQVGSRARHLVEGPGVGGRLAQPGDGNGILFRPCAGQSAGQPVALGGELADGQRIEVRGGRDHAERLRVASTLAWRASSRSVTFSGSGASSARSTRAGRRVTPRIRRRWWRGPSSGCS